MKNGFNVETWTADCQRSTYTLSIQRSHLSTYNDLPQNGLLVKVSLRLWLISLQELDHRGRGRTNWEEHISL